MTKSRSSFGKLNRERDKQAKARAKQEARAERRERRLSSPGEGGVADPPPRDQAAVLDELATLHEELRDGAISMEAFELRQEELRDELRVD